MYKLNGIGPKGIHSTQIYNVSFFRNPTGNSSLPTVDVIFEVNSIVPDKCSLLGGCTITINGHGLRVKNLNDYDITIGNAPCSIPDSFAPTDTEIQCYFGDSSLTHKVTNNGTDTSE